MHSFTAGTRATAIIANPKLANPLNLRGSKLRPVYGIDAKSQHKKPLSDSTVVTFRLFTSNSPASSLLRRTSLNISRGSGAIPSVTTRVPRYLEYAAEMPFHFLVDNGFDFRTFGKAQLGPVTFKQQVIHVLEVRFGDRITIDHKLRGLSSDTSRWAFRHRIIRADGKHAATVEAEGAFFSLRERKITKPPSSIVELIRRLPRDDDFKDL